ncbi:MAG: transporter [Micavibrio sp.]
MGGLSSFANTAMQAVNLAGNIMGVVNAYQSGRNDYRDSRDLRALELQQQAERAAMEQQKIALDAQGAESERRAALRRAVARQRARYGAGGTGSYDGSAQAVLLGLFDESDEEAQRRTALDTLRTRALDQGIAQRQSINTLQLTQMKERERLKTATAVLNSLSSFG